MRIDYNPYNLRSSLCISIISIKMVWDVVSYVAGIMCKYIHGVYKNYLTYQCRTHHVIGEGDRNRHRCACDTLIHSELTVLAFKINSILQKLSFLQSSPTMFLWDIWDPYPGLTSILPGYNVQNWLSVPILKVRILPIWPLSCFPWSQMSAASLRF